MERVEMDRDLVVRQLDARAALESGRQREMLAVYREHMIHEMGGHLDELMATMVAEPQFHGWGPTGDQSPKGREAVLAFYGEWFDLKANWFDVELHRIVVDDDVIAVEMTQRMVMPCASYFAGRWGRGRVGADGTIPEGFDIGGHCFMVSRSAGFVPFDEHCLMMGEDGYGTGKSDVRQLADDELPAGYLEFLAS